MASAPSDSAFLKRAIVNMSLLLAALVSIFLASELLLRWYISAWPFEKPLRKFTHLSEKDRPLRWRFSNTEGRNQLGLRNDDILPKQDDGYRILYLGDSMVWTGETSSGELYTEVIESVLNDSLTAFPKTIEIINAGIPGYTTYQEYEFLKIYGLDMQPDMVILGFVFNDLYYKYLHKPTDGNMLAGDPAIHLSYFDGSQFPAKLFRNSYIAHKVYSAFEILGKIISGRKVYSFENRGDFYLAWKEHGWRRARRLIQEIAELLRCRNIDFLIVAYPISEQMTASSSMEEEAFILFPQRQIKKICQQNDIPLLDLTPAIKDNGGETLYQDYLHFNASGNDVVAKAVSNFIMESVVKGNTNDTDLRR